MMDVVLPREEEFKNFYKGGILRWQDILDQDVDFVEEKE